MDVFQACIKVLGTTHKLTKVTDLNGYTGGIHYSGLTQRLSHADYWLYYENGPEVHCTYQCHDQAKFIPFLSVVKNEGSVTKEISYTVGRNPN